MPAPIRVTSIAKPIASRFGLNQCRPCATALREAFRRSGLHGYVAQLTTLGGRGYIVMRDTNFRLPFVTPPGQQSIANNRQHFGVVVDDYVFDNIFRDGTPFSGWQAQFDCDVHRFTLLKIESF